MIYNWQNTYPFKKRKMRGVATNESHNKLRLDYLGVMPSYVLQRLLCHYLLDDQYNASDSRELANILNKRDSEDEDKDKDAIRLLAAKLVKVNNHHLKNFIDLMKLANVNRYYLKNIKDFKKTELGKWAEYYLLFHKQTQHFSKPYSNFNGWFVKKKKQYNKQELIKQSILRAVFIMIGICLSASFTCILSAFTDLSLMIYMFIGAAAAMLISVAAICGMIMTGCLQNKFINEPVSLDGKKILVEVKERLEQSKIKEQIEKLLQDLDTAIKNQIVNSESKEMLIKDMECIKPVIEKQIQALLQELDEIVKKDGIDKSEAIGVFNGIHVQLALVESQMIKFIKALAMNMLDPVENQRKHASPPLLWKDQKPPAPSEPSLVLY